MAKGNSRSSKWYTFSNKVDTARSMVPFFGTFRVEFTLEGRRRLTSLTCVGKSILELVLAVSVGIALSVSLGYLTYAMPGNAVNPVDWTPDPLAFRVLLSAVLGALIGLSALQFIRGRRTISRKPDGRKSKAPRPGNGPID